MKVNYLLKICLQLFLFKCAPKSTQPPIGFQLSNPAFVSAYNSNFYILNSNSLLKFDMGSILAITPSGEAWGSVPVPSGGTAMAITKDLVAIAICPPFEKSYINLYEVTQGGLPSSHVLKKIDLENLLGHYYTSTLGRDESGNRPRIKNIYLNHLEGDVYNLALELGGAPMADGFIFLKLNRNGDVLADFYHEEIVANHYKPELSGILKIKAENLLYFGSNSDSSIARFMVFSSAKNTSDRNLNQYVYNSNALTPYLDKNTSTSYYVLSNSPGLKGAVYDSNKNTLFLLKNNISSNNEFKGSIEKVDAATSLFFEPGNLLDKGFESSTQVISQNIPSEYLDKILMTATFENHILWASYKDEKRKDIVSLHVLDPSLPDIVKTETFHQEGSFAIGHDGQYVLGASFYGDSLEMWKYSNGKLKKIWQK